MVVLLRPSEEATLTTSYVSLNLHYETSYIYIYLARTPEIGQGLGRILSCGARKPEQTWVHLLIIVDSEPPPLELSAG